MGGFRLGFRCVLNGFQVGSRWALDEFCMDYGWVPGGFKLDSKYASIWSFVSCWLILGWFLVGKIPRVLLLPIHLSLLRHNFLLSVLGGGGRKVLEINVMDKVKRIIDNG